MKAVRGYKLILFDLDGTLTDPKPGITRAVQYALSRYSISVADLDTLTPFIGPPLHHAFTRYYGFDERQARQAVIYYREYFADIGLYENAVYSGIPSLLDRLRSAGIRLIVATSKPTVYAERIVDHFGLGVYFTQVAGSELDLARSDKAQIIGDILNAYPDVARWEAVMVGDREHDIIGARAHHLDAIGVTYGYGSRAELRAAGATSIAGSVAELAGILL